MEYARSLKPGSTAAERRVIAGAVAANGVPTLSEQFIPVGRFDAIDCVARCTGGGGSFDVRIHWRYDPLETIVYDDDIGAVAVTTAGGLEQFPILNNPNPRCATGVYVEVLNFAGGGTADVWLIGRER